MIETPNSQIPHPNQKSFFHRLAARASAADSLLCVGLDPRGEDAESCRAECIRLIDATADFAAAFKPNSAFFEAHGPQGIAALKDVIAHVPAGIPVILDAKRGDIGATAQAYARAIFDELKADAVTANPYLGRESLAPLMADPARGVFVLCRTSNPGADEVQTLEISGEPLYLHLARQVLTWGSEVGLVVGATDPEALARVRAVAPEAWILAPGVGAQGASLQAALEAGLSAGGGKLLIVAARSIASAPDPRAEAKRLRDEINRVSRIADGRSPIADRVSSGVRNTPYAIRHLAMDLLEAGCVKFGEFMLKSGVTSPIYLDLRRLVSRPNILRRVAQAYVEKLRELRFDRLAGIPYAGLPIATAIALEMDRPLLYPRRETKDYGTRAAIEGEFAPGEAVVVIDDLATTGGTKIETIQRLGAAGLIVHDVVVLIDREQGAGKMLADAGVQLHALVTLRQLLEEWRAAGEITRGQHEEVAAFLDSS